MGEIYIYIYIYVCIYVYIYIYMYMYFSVLGIIAILVLGIHSAFVYVDPQGGPGYVGCLTGIRRAPLKGMERYRRRCRGRGGCRCR